MALEASLLGVGVELKVQAPSGCAIVTRGKEV